MSDETITPALTPEEWKRLHFDREALQAERFRNLFDGRSTGNLGLRLKGDMWATEMPRECHALAALCLYGQPFGFTHGDVRALRAFDFQFWGNDEDSVLVRRADCEALHRLASRIAALLPPEDATP